MATDTIGYHPTTPIVSQERICLPLPTNCQGGCGLLITVEPSHLDTHGTEESVHFNEMSFDAWFLGGGVSLVKDSL